MPTDRNSQINMIGVDGRVRQVPLYLKDGLLKQGWGIVANPKEEYYPAFDRTIKNNTAPNQNMLNPGSLDMEAGDLLEVELL